jgi:glutaryl-CoA dehydrogenase
VKLSAMLAELTSMQLVCHRLGQLAMEGKLNDTKASLAKLHNCRKARWIAAEARDLLGGNGILLDYEVARHMADLEAVFTYEGTDTIQALIVGHEVTGQQAFV